MYYGWMESEWMDGVPLKSVISKKLVVLIIENFAKSVKSFRVGEKTINFYAEKISSRSRRYLT